MVLPFWYSTQLCAVMVNPGGTGRPMRHISARPAPLPPRTDFIELSPSSKAYTRLGPRAEGARAAARGLGRAFRVVLGACARRAGLTRRPSWPLVKRKWGQPPPRDGNMRHSRKAI